jgi:heme A synthase
VAMVHFALPLPLATLHNAGAALLVICTVTLLRVLRPARSTGMVPLSHGHRTR